ncbi:MAG: 1-acyl-sn-glycerol-3-phosphate acyltransferase, partial [Nitrospinota bacterium]
TPHRRQIKELLLRQHRPEKRCLPGATTPWTPQTKAETRLVQELSRLSGYPAAQIHPSHHLELDLGIDSLMKMELLLLLETLSPQKGAATALPVEQLLQKVHTVQDLLALLHPSPDPKPRSRSPEKQAFDAFQYLTTRNSLFYQCATRLFHFLLRHTYQHYFRLQCRGLEHLPSTRPYIIAANHTSHLDSGAIITALGKEARHLYILGARDYFFNHPWKGWFFNTFLHVLPFDRHENFLQGVRVSKEALSQGHSLLIYPEGTRSITGALQPFKRGLGFLACEARVPIVPAYIHGSYEALPKGAVFPKRRKITVTFGPPVSIDAFCARRGKMPNHLLYQEVIENVRRRIEELRDHHLRAE